MALKLYEIDQALYDCFDDENGEFDQEKFERLTGERNEKLEGIVLGIKNLTADAAAIREEELNLARRRKIKERKAESMRNFLALCLNGQKLETARCCVTWKSSKALQVYDPQSIPGKYLKQAEPTFDKVAITADIKNGISVAGAALVQRTNMIIK